MGTELNVGKGVQEMFEKDTIQTKFGLAINMRSKIGEKIVIKEMMMEFEKSGSVIGRFMPKLNSYVEQGNFFQNLQIIVKSSNKYLEQLSLKLGLFQKTAFFWFLEVEMTENSCGFPRCLYVLEPLQVGTLF